jgi:hypothetical protein
VSASDEGGALLRDGVRDGARDGAGHMARQQGAVCRFPVWKFILPNEPTMRGLNQYALPRPSHLANICTRVQYTTLLGMPCDKSVAAVAKAPFLSCLI